MIQKHELIKDIAKTDAHVSNELTARQYNRFGKYTAQTAINKFGSWNKAKKIAGISPAD